MNYTGTFFEMKDWFNSDWEKETKTFRELSCTWINFTSGNSRFLKLSWNPGRYGLINGSYAASDESILENNCFRYPVFYRSNGLNESKGAIILLHGLNERSWLKYLVWAASLAESTGKPVILFPIAFHMNRSPAAWSSPRAMAPLVSERTNRLGHADKATVANVALSVRLSDDPLRFYTSGGQSAADLLQLIQQLLQDQHPIIKGIRQVDFFAYSIGAFLAQVLLLGNPGNLLNNSRFFLFCGGALFDRMNGVSRLIMDQPAFARLRQFYINELNQASEQCPELKDSLCHSELGNAFLAMLSQGNNPSFRQRVFSSFEEQMLVIGMQDDTVIPMAGIREAFGQRSQVLEWEADFQNSHENPFPVSSDLQLASRIDNSFRKIFMRAANFLI